MNPFTAFFLHKDCPVAHEFEAYRVGGLPDGFPARVARVTPDWSTLVEWCVMRCKDSATCPAKNWTVQPARYPTLEKALESLR